MSETDETSSTDVRALSRPFWALFVLSFVGILLLSFGLAFALNINTLRKSERILDSVLAERLERLADLTLEYAYWDEAVANMVVRQNPAWIALNYDQHLFDGFRASSGTIIDADGASVLTNIGGEIVAQDGLAPFEDQIQPIISAARGTERDQPPVPQVAIVSSPTEVRLAAAALMTTYTEEKDISTDHVMVFTRAVNEPMLDEIAARFDLPELAISTIAPGYWQASRRVPTVSGSPATYFVWSPTLPGFQILPWLFVGLLCVFAVMLLTARAFLARADHVLEAVRRAEKSAVTADQAKSEFVRNVAHELRTPLNAVKGFADVMRAETFGPIENAKYKEYTDDIANVSEHATNIISDLLDFEKIGSGEVPFEFAKQDAVGTAKEALNFVREQAKGKSVDLVFAPAANDVELVTDRRALMQILINLLSNAVKFTPRGGQVTCAVKSSGAHDVRFEVIDTGRGMTDAELERALQPFGQIDPEEDLRQRGTGLGLPITKRLAESLGGQFVLESQVGSGSLAIVILPLSRAA